LGIMKLRTGEPWMPAPDYGRSLKALTINLLVRAIDTALQFLKEVLRADLFGFARGKSRRTVRDLARSWPRAISLPKCR